VDPFTVIIAEAEAIVPLSVEAVVEPLGQGFVRVDVTEQAWERIGAALAQDQERFGALDAFVSLVLRSTGLRQEGGGAVAYLEAEALRQSGVACLDGVVVESWVTPASIPVTDRAVNAALRRIGVVRDGAADECAAIGLILPF
jgi:hypothetical protein